MDVRLLPMIVAMACAALAAPSFAQEIIEDISPSEMKAVLEEHDAVVTDVETETNSVWLTGKTSDGVGFVIELGECTGGEARRCAEVGYEAQFKVGNRNYDMALALAASYDVPAVREDFETLKCVYYLRLEGGLTRKNLSLTTDNFLISIDLAFENLSKQGYMSPSASAPKINLKDVLKTDGLQ